MGDRDSIYGFASAGIDIFPVEDAAAAGGRLKDLAENGYAVIYVTESLYTRIEKEIDSYRESVLPAIIPIPGISGNSGYGMHRIKKFVEQAVGSDILFGRE